MFYFLNIIILTLFTRTGRCGDIEDSLKDNGINNTQKEKLWKKCVSYQDLSSGILSLELTRESIHISVANNIEIPPSKFLMKELQKLLFSDGHLEKQGQGFHYISFWVG